MKKKKDFHKVITLGVALQYEIKKIRKIIKEYDEALKDLGGLKRKKKQKT